MCFLPGTLMLAVHNGLDKKYEQFAKDMLETCVQMYKRMPTGLSAELVYFNQGPSAHVQEDITVRVSFLTTCKWCYASLILCYTLHLTSGAILGTHYSHNLWKVLEKLLLVFILSLHLLGQIFLVVMREMNS